MLEWPFAAQPIFPMMLRERAQAAESGARFQDRSHHSGMVLDEVSIADPRPRLPDAFRKRRLRVPAQLLRGERRVQNTAWNIHVAFGQELHGKRASGYRLDGLDDVQQAAAMACPTLNTRDVPSCLTAWISASMTSSA